MSDFNDNGVWRVFIRDLRVMLHLGIRDWEYGTAQEVVVNVEMVYPASNKPVSGDVADVVDYSKIADRVLEEWPKREHLPLLEQWAEELLEMCFEDARVIEAKVNLVKTAPYKGAEVGVELCKRRNAL